MERTDFQKVVDFNHQFGVNLHFSLQPNIFDTEPKNVEFCMKLIREEIKELNDAVVAKDYIETIDALADILYVVYGMGARIGVDMDLAMDVFRIDHTTLTMEWLAENKNTFDYGLNYTNDKENTHFQRITAQNFNKTNNASFDCITNCDYVLSTYLKEISNSLNNVEFAVANKDYSQTIKNLCSIAHYSYLTSALLGTDMDVAFNIVHENNMSKLCATEDLAKETVQHYILQKDTLGYDSPAYRLAPNGIHYVVYNESTKKILKSKSWKPVDLTTMYQS